jgi:hypothetical protein
VSRHEIDIEGLSSEWEPIAVAIPGEGEKIWTSKGIVSTVSAIHCEPALIVRRKVRKYDWSKTLNDVLIRLKTRPGLFLKEGFPEPEILQIGTSWQPNIHGKCPVDGEACWVRIRTVGGATSERLAKDVLWDFVNAYPVTAWQFIRLADGVEW